MSQQDRIASAREVASYFREDCRTLRDSLQLEMVVAQYHLRMRDALTSQRVPVGDAISAGVIAELERHGDPLSHAILRGLAYVDASATAQRSADAVARLVERGVGLPREFADVTEAHAVGAWRAVEGGHAGQYALFVEFEHPNGPAHSFALFVVPRRGAGVVKHIALMNPMSDLDPDEPFHPSALDTLEIAAAGALMHDVLDRSYGSSLAGVDDYRVLLAAARARSMEREGAGLDSESPTTV